MADFKIFIKFCFLNVETEIQIFNWIYTGFEWYQLSYCNWFFFLAWQFLTWFESEMDFSVKAVSDFEFENIARFFNSQHSDWESPSLLYSIWNLKFIRFLRRRKLYFFSETITKIWTFLITETKYLQKIDYI